jgi:hypothetical protein
MRPNVSSLAMRRPALAALIGIHPAEGHFGSERTPRNRASFGGFGFGYDDAEYGVDVAELDPLGTGSHLATDSRMLSRDDRELASAARLSERRRERAAQARMELDPNHGQTLKLGHYSFGLAQALTIGLAASIFISDSPSTTMRIKNVVMNVPQVAFVTLNSLLIANVAVTVGGAEDAYAYSAGGFSNHVDYPTLPPSQKATISAAYTGFSPAPFFAGQSFPFSCRFSGKSTVAGGC